jgi:hypothetical protein
MATPHVAGAAAILRGEGLSPQRTVDTLLETAKDIGASGDDLTFGHGRLDVGAAVAGLPKSGPSTAGSAGSSRESAERPANRSTDEAPAPVLPQPADASRSPKNTPASGSPHATSDRDEPRASPRDRAAAADEDGRGSSALPNIIVGSVLLAALGGLLAFGRLRQIRGRGAG